MIIPGMLQFQIATPKFFPQLPMECRLPQRGENEMLLANSSAHTSRKNSGTSSVVCPQQTRCRRRIGGTRQC